MPGPSLLRPRDTDALRAALRQLSVEGEVPVLFGGEVHGDTLLLTEFFGTRTGNLRGLAVRARSGLGGASMVAGRPMSVSDYRNAVTITHDYDRPVLSEGIRSVLAVPVVVDGRPGRCSMAPTGRAHQSADVRPTGWSPRRGRCATRSGFVTKWTDGCDSRGLIWPTPAT